MKHASCSIFFLIYPRFCAAFWDACEGFLPYLGILPGCKKAFRPLNVLAPIPHLSKPGSNAKITFDINLIGLLPLSDSIKFIESII